MEVFVNILLLYSVWSSLCYCCNAQASCPPGCSICDDNGEWRCEDNNLVRIPSPLPENLTSLVLRSQNIPTIYKDDFSGVRSFMKISVRYCNVLNIEHGAFENLTFLEELDFYSNYMTTVDVHLYRDLHSLRILDFSFNDIELIENGTFTYLDVLEQLHLSGNNFKSLSVGTFRGLHNLDKLYLSYNNIESIEIGTFTDLDRLELLNLGGNNLKNNLSVGTFRGLHSLEYLYISSNDIEYIEDGTFEPLLSLTYLNMGFNKLTYINASSLKGPERLGYLYLEYNDLISLEIPPSSLPSLHSLHVEENIEFSIKPCGLENLPNLQEFLIRHTAVNFSLDLFISGNCNDNEHIPPLGYLLIEYTKTNYISVDLMSRLPNLYYFSFGGGDIYVEAGALEVLPQLTNLKLYDENMPPSFYQQSIINPLPELTWVYIYDLKTLPTQFFDRISNVLYYIWIVYPQFNELPSEAFGNIPSLNTIYISYSYSQIISIDKDTFKGVPNLINLYLQSLQLSFLPYGLLDHTPYLQKLHLDSNPLSCNCSMEWLVKFTDTHNLTVSGHCSSPPELEGVPLSSLTIEDFNCTDITTTVDYAHTSSSSIQSIHLSFILLGVFGVIVIILVVSLVVVFTLRYTKRDTHRDGGNTISPACVTEEGKCNNAYSIL